MHASRLHNLYNRYKDLMQKKYASKNEITHLASYGGINYFIMGIEP